MNLVYVGIPFYNAEKYLDYAIRSVLNQTYTNWKMTLIDDGSTDSSLALARKYTSDTRVKVISDGRNKGLVYRLNELVKLSDCKYFVRMDADDIMHPQRLEKQLRYLVLARDVGIFVLERPDAVENVVRSRGAEKPQRIGHIFVQLQPLLAEIGDAEIDEDARAADDAEFEKLFYHKFPTSVGTDFPLNQFV